MLFSTSETYLLEQKAKHYEDDYCEGEESWNRRKKDIILQWGETLEKLYDYGAFVGPISSICTYMRERLRQRGLSEGAINYVSAVAPQKWKNESQMRLGFPRQIEDERLDKLDFYSLAKYTKKEVFDNLDRDSKIKVWNRFLEVARDRKRFEREHKQTMMTTLIQNGEKLDEITENKQQLHLLTEYPPQQYWGESKSSLVVRDIAQELKRLSDIFFDLEQEIIHFKPNEELDAKMFDDLVLLRDYFFKTMVKFWSAYTDKKQIDSWFGWTDYVIKYFDHGNNAAASKKKLLTGEFIVQRDKQTGKEKIIPLEKRVTNEHLKEKIPQIIEDLKRVHLFLIIFRPMEEWFREPTLVYGRNEGADKKEIEKIIETCKQYHSNNS